MIKVYPASSRYSAKSDWLQSNFSFSFGPYYDMDNTAFGPMRVLNDDFIAGGRGFGAHPHSDMEVVSLVLEGALKHQDNIGNVGVTTWGEIQRMSAGTGIIHTEFNASKTDRLNLLQMWFMPEKRGLEPNYEITRFDVNALFGTWLPIVSRNASENVAKINQDMTIYLTRLRSGDSLGYTIQPSRRAFVFVIDGGVNMNDEFTLDYRDSVRVTDEMSLQFTAREDTRIMLIDMPGETE